MTDGALPKGMEKGSSSAPKKRGADKMGISVAIGITAVALIIGIGFTGVIPMDDETFSFMEPAPSAPIVQEKPTTPVIQQAPSATYSSMQSSSYLSSDRDLIDQLEWSISTGDVMSMYLDKGSSGLIIYTDTVDDAELFVGLNADYIGSDDGTFFIIVGGEESNDYEQAGNDLFISFPAGTEKIEIVGSYAVPEFGTIAMIVLAVAIVSIIAITAKTRTTLIPKL